MDYSPFVEDRYLDLDNNYPIMRDDPTFGQQELNRENDQWIMNDNHATSQVFSDQDRYFFEPPRLIDIHPGPSYHDTDPSDDQPPPMAPATQTNNLKEQLREEATSS